MTSFADSNKSSWLPGSTSPSPPSSLSFSSTHGNSIDATTRRTSVSVQDEESDRERYEQRYEHRYYEHEPPSQAAHETTTERRTPTITVQTAQPRPPAPKKTKSWAERRLSALFPSHQPVGHQQPPPLPVADKASLSPTRPRLLQRKSLLGRRGHPPSNIYPPGGAPELPTLSPSAPTSASLLPSLPHDHTGRIFGDALLENFDSQPAQSHSPKMPLSKQDRHGHPLRPLPQNMSTPNLGQPPAQPLLLSPPDALPKEKTVMRRMSAVFGFENERDAPMPVLPPRQPSPASESRGRNNAAQPPKSSVPNLMDVRPGSGHSLSAQSATGHEREGRKLRRTWMPGGRSRSASRTGKGPGSYAWTMTDNAAEYNTKMLTGGEMVCLASSPEFLTSC